MKKIINLILTAVIISAVIFLSIVLPGCTKENLQRAQSGSIEMIINGKHKLYEQVNGGTVRTNSENVYSFTGTTEPANSNYFNLSFQSNTLQPGTYVFAGSTGVVLFRDGSETASNVTSNPFTVTITSNESGIVCGTFSGMLVDGSGNNCAVLQGRITSVYIQ